MRSDRIAGRARLFSVNGRHRCSSGDATLSASRARSAEASRNEVRSAASARQARRSKIAADDHATRLAPEARSDLADFGGAARTGLPMQRGQPLGHAFPPNEPRPLPSGCGRLQLTHSLIALIIQ